MLYHLYIYTSGCISKNILIISRTASVLNSLDNFFSIIPVQLTFWVQSMVSEAQSFEYFKPMWKLNQSLELIRFKFKL